MLRGLQGYSFHSPQHPVQSSRSIPSRRNEVESGDLCAAPTAATAKTGAEQARNDALAAIAGGVADFYPGARSNVPQGATGTGAITGGSGGTDGTFALGFTGGNFAVNGNGAVSFNVANGGSQGIAAQMYLLA